MAVFELVLSDVPKLSIIRKSDELARGLAVGEGVCFRLLTWLHREPRYQSHSPNQESTALSQHFSLCEHLQVANTCGFAGAWLKLSKSIICGPQRLYLLATMKNLCIASIRSISIFDTIFVSRTHERKDNGCGLSHNSTNLIYGKEVFPLVPIRVLAAIFHIFSATNDVALRIVRRVGRVAVMHLVKSFWESSWTGSVRDESYPLVAMSS